jgi:heat-inducible transcriptional repressor
MINELNQRSQAILKYIVDTYVDTGAPVGSRTISGELGLNLSPATIRGVMAELEQAGLLEAPHTSAGRIPTQQGLRFYIDGLMETGNLTEEERRRIETGCRPGEATPAQLYERASGVLSGLSAAAGLVIAPTGEDKPVRQIQFVAVAPTRILVILLMQDGLIENRVMNVAAPVPAAALTAAANYLNDRLAGTTLREAQARILAEIDDRRARLDLITADLVRRGIALVPPEGASGHLIVRGQSKLLSDVRAVEDIESARAMLSMLEEQQMISRLLEATQKAQGVEIFLGTENRMFDRSGWSMVLAPYRAGGSRIVGAIGVIGPTRLNYSRVIPIVDYTSKVIERLAGRD